MDAQWLLTLYDVNQIRRQRVIYGLLKNQLTVSTAYNGMLYHQFILIGQRPWLTKQEYDQTLQQLIQAQWLTEVAKGQMQVTALGLEQQTLYWQNHYRVQHVLMFERYDVSGFRDAFLLANQVVSEASFESKSYYPLPADNMTKNWVKKWYHANKHVDIVFQWAQQLKTYLETLPRQDADWLTSTWVGHEVPGMTHQQIAGPTSWDEEDYYWWELDQYAQLIEFALANPKSLIGKLFVPYRRLTISASNLLTYQAFEQGMSVNEIQKQRRLKISTIREHLMLSAMLVPLDQFSYERILNVDVVAYFQTRLTQPLTQWSFDQVKNQGTAEEFFYFRLYAIQQFKKAEQSEDQVNE